PLPPPAPSTTSTSPATTLPRSTSPVHAVRCGIQKPAASTSLSPAGTGTVDPGYTRHSSANPPHPWVNMVTPITFVPTARSTPSPTAVTVPVASWPHTNGSGGVRGYTPRHIRTSGSPRPAAATRILACPAPGSGTSRSACTMTAPGSPRPTTCQARIPVL